MSFKDRYKLAVEEAEAALMENNDGSSEIDVSDVIAAEEDAAELQQMSEQVESDLQAVEQGEEVVGELEEQIEANEATLAQPEGGEIKDEATGEVTEVEPISDDAVVASQEAFIATVARLGYKYADLKSNRLSVESIKADNMTALRLSTEGMKEMAKNIVEKIKQIIANIMNWIKKMYAKVVVAVSNCAKQAEKLKNKIQEMKDAKIVENDKLKEALKSKVGLFGTLTANYFTSNTIAKAVDFISVVGTAEPGKSPDMTNVADAFNKLGGDAKCKQAFRVNGGKITGINDSDDYVSLDIPADKLPEIKPDSSGKVSAYIAGLDRIIKAGDKAAVKTYVGKVEAYQKEILKQVEDLAKQEGDDIKEKAKRLRVLAAKGSVDGVLGYIGTMKALMSAINTLISGKADDKGGDKKPEEKKEDTKPEEGK